MTLSGKNFIIDNKSCSVFYENIIKSKFRIIKREDPTYYLKAIKNKTEIDNMKKEVLKKNKENFHELESNLVIFEKIYRRIAIKELKYLFS